MTVPKAISAAGLLSTSQVAEKLDVDRTTVWLWIKNGAMRAKRFGSFYGVSPQAIKEFCSIYQIPAKKKKRKPGKASKKGAATNKTAPKKKGSRKRNARKKK